MRIRPSNRPNPLQKAPESAKSVKKQKKSKNRVDKGMGM